MLMRKKIEGFGLKSAGKKDCPRPAEFSFERIASSVLLGRLRYPALNRSLQASTYGLTFYSPMNPKYLASLPSAKQLAVLTRIVPFAFGLALTASTACAALIAHDPFNGTTLANGGTGWLGDWFDPGEGPLDPFDGIAATDNLSFGGLTSSGGAAALRFYTNGQSTRLFPAQTTGTVWFSWIQRSGPVTSGNPNQIRFMNGSAFSMVIGQHFARGNFRIFSNSTTEPGQPVSQVNSGRPFAGTNLVVVSVNLDTDVVNLYINPTGIGAAAPTSAVTATWTAPANYFTSINGLQSVGSDGLTATPPNPMVWDEVRVGTTWADVTPGTGDAPPEPIPAAPSGLTAVANSFSDVNLTWADNSTNESSFALERSTDAGTTWTLLASLPSGTQAFQSISLTALSSYQYRVRASNSSGSSAYSNIASVTTPALPALVPLPPIYLPFADDDGVNVSLLVAVPGFASYSDPGLISEASALSYPGVPASAGRGLAVANNAAASGTTTLTLDTTLPGFARYLSGGAIGASGMGTLYVSWMASGIIPQAAYNVEFSDGTGTCAVGTTFGNDFIRLMTANDVNSGIQNYVTTPLAPPVGTAFYVAKFTFGPGTSSVVNLYVNQLTEGTPVATATGYIAFNRIGIVKFGPPSLFAFDELRIGTTWESVGGSASAPLTPIQSWFAGFMLPTDGSALMLDSDNDNAVNLLEYAFNSSPTSASDRNLPTTSKVNVSGSDFLAITFVRRTTAGSGITYTPQASGDLSDWTGVPVQVGSAVDNGNGTEMVVFRDTVALTSGVKRFLRVQVATSAP